MCSVDHVQWFLSAKCMGMYTLHSMQCANPLPNSSVPMLSSGFINFIII